jgi:hypothetical protein
MRLSLLLTGMLVGAIALSNGVQAQNYPWCAIYNMGEWASSCSFVTEDQCWNSVRGVGGFCTANNSYQPSAPELYSRRRHRPS